MRLNRVLQTTVAVGIATAVTVFTISCSDGEAGAAGTSCTIAPSATGYDVLCGGAKYGELLNPAQDATGPAGDQGPAGPNGASCILGAQNTTTGSFQILCGGTSAGSLDGCAVTAEEATIVTAGSPGVAIHITCGSTNVSLCKAGSSQAVFDPLTQECRAGAVLAPSVQYCDKDAETPSIKYQPATEYCGYASAADLKAGRVSAQTLCGKDGKPNDDTSTVWRNEYCRVYYGPDLEKSTATAPVFTTTYKVETPVDCDGTFIKLNAGTSPAAWNGEYCGWATEKAAKRTKIGQSAVTVANSADGIATAPVGVAGALCNDGNGPYEYAFNGGYCQALAEMPGLNARVQGSAAFCGSDRKTGNRVNETTWKHQYCTYKSITATAKSVEQVATLVAAPSTDPKAFKIAHDCAVLAPNSEPVEGSTTAEKTANFEYCQVDKDTVVTLSTPAQNVANFGCPAGTRLNEKDWKGEFCWWASPTAKNKTVKKPEAKEGGAACGILAPNSGDAPPASTSEVEYCQMSPDKKTLVLAKPSENDCYNGVSKLNEGTYKAQYCGYATATAKNKTVIDFTTNSAFTNDAALACGALKPNTEQPEGANGTEQAKNFQYCQMGPDGKIALAKPSDNDCGTTVQLNLGSWKGEYCGWSSSSTTAKPKVKVTPTATQGGPACGALAPNSKSQPETQADMEYCTELSYGAGLSIAIEGLKTSIGGANPQDANSCGRINEGGWKNDYCLIDNNSSAANNGYVGVRQCAGGTRINEGYDTTALTGDDAGTGLNILDPNRADTRVCVWPDE